ncbi:MAG: hypothetical protein AAGE52_11940 [Myxococcota bacterium]
MTKHLICALSMLLACGDDDEGVADAPRDDGSAAPLTCAEVDRRAGGVSVGNIDSDVTLSGVIQAPSSRVTHTGGTITIEAGTVFLMPTGSHIKFGFGGAAGSVQMNGTPTEPILFCGTSATPGTYGNIDFGPQLVNSYLRHVRFEDGGDANGPGNPLTNGPSAALRFAGDAQVELTNVVVRNGQGIGINASSLSTSSSALTITEMSGTPLHLRTSGAVNALPSGSYTGNGEDVIEIADVHNGAATIRFRNVGVPFRQVTQRVNFGVENHVVNFDAGVEYQFAPGAFMVVGFGGSAGTLNVNGTAAEPVIFTSGAPVPAAGDWNGLQLGPQTQTGSQIEHAEFRFGGSAPSGDCREGNANLSLSGGADTNLNVTNVRFADSAGFGVCIVNGVQQVNGNPDPEAGIREGNVFDANASGDVSIVRPR